MMATSTLLTTRFGDVEFCDEDVLTIKDGLLGFPEHTRFLILQHREGSPFRWLQSVEDPKLAFLVTDPVNFVQDYEPEMAPECAQDLGLDEQTPRLVYAIATVPKGCPEQMTINLAGPIVINAASRVARQLVIEHPSCPIKHRLMPTAVHNRKSAAA